MWAAAINRLQHIAPLYLLLITLVDAGASAPTSDDSSPRVNHGSVNVSSVPLHTLPQANNKPTTTANESSPSRITIGVVLSPQSGDTSTKLEAAIRKHLNITHTTGNQIDIVTSEMVANPIEMSKIVCQQLLAAGVSAVIVSTDPIYMDSIASISFTLALYNIPVIGTRLRGTSLFNKNLHSSYISLTPPDSHQADVWYHLMVELGFKRAFVLSSVENHDLLSRFVDLVDGRQTDSERRIDIEAIIEHDSVAFGEDSESAWLHLVRRLSSVMENSICRVFLIHAQSKDDALIFMKLLDHLNLTTSPDTALIFTEKTAQLASDLDVRMPIGAIWSRLSGLNDPIQAQELFAIDALDIVLRAIDEISDYLAIEQRKLLLNSCQVKPSDIDWHAGVELYRAIRRQQFVGLTGYISFDDDGDRLTAKYELLNAHSAGKFRSIGEFWNGQTQLARTDETDANLAPKILINVSSITWPGGTSGHSISGVHIDRHLSIVTIEEKPFVWLLDEQECRPAGASSSRRNAAARIPCRRMTANNPAGERHCCKGYCMDLLREISHRLNFTYDLYLVPDNQYGNLMHEPHRPPKWDGLIGELAARRADMAFAPLTITLKRAQAIDFSKPFKFHGFSILLRRAPQHTTLASFLQPFHNLLWILVIGVATHVVALTLYLLDRYSTFGRFGIKRGFIPEPSGPSGSGNGDRPLHLAGSLWFSWSILLNSGIGEHTPKSLSGRVLGIFWSGFAMIVVASYTANLAAFLVLDSREDTPTLSGIDDPRLRSGDLAFNFATIKNSAVDAYLQSQVEYINLYRKMEEFDFGKVDEAIRALRAGAIDALIWDSTRLEWEVATDANCSLGIAGELFGSGGYGIGLQQRSHWTNNVTTKLLELHESGFMIELDKKWVAAGRGPGGREEVSSSSPELDGFGAPDGSDNQPANVAAPDHCGRRAEDKPETLGIFNIAGVFILFAGGLAISLGLIGLERLCYKHHQRSRIRRQDRKKIAYATPSTSNEEDHHQ